MGDAQHALRHSDDSPRHGSDLPEGCVTEALAIIRDVGIENLSLREVARRLGVSHQAPYRHFPSRDHLLAEVVDRCFRDFDAALAQAPRGASPAEGMRALGRCYLDYAARHPLEYRLMFGARLPDPREHPRMMEKGCSGFDQLRERIARLIDQPAESEAVALEAMFVWSTVHGLASILETEAMSALGIDAGVQRIVSEHVLARIGRGLGSPGPQPG